MFELIRYDVLNGTRKQHKELSGKIFNNQAELDKFRSTIQAEYPNYEVFLTYRDLRK